MNQLEKLLAAIEKAPDDPMLRVYLADHLEELGMTAEAEFVRVDGEYVSSIPNDERAKARDEFRKAVDAMTDQWLLRIWNDNNLHWNLGNKPVSVAAQQTVKDSQ